MKINICLLRYSVIVLILLALPAVVRAQFTFTTNNGAITITGYTGDGGAVLIPSTTNGYAVVSISNQAFYDCTNLVSIIIPDSISNIGDYAFEGCTNLTSVYFQGNAPLGDGTIFSGDSAAIVYYLSGTTGWDPMFGGAPTAWYTPESEFVYAPNSGSLTLTITAGPGGAVVIPANAYGGRSVPS